MLASFDFKGTGYINYANGQPWVIIKASGWSVSDASGTIVERGSHPRVGAPLECQVTEDLRIDFFDSKRIRARFQTSDVDRTFECGATSKRADSHLDGVLSRRKGKLELDVTAIRARVAEQGNLYVTVGPHGVGSAPTLPSGTGNIALRIATLVDPASAVLPITESLHETAQRVARVSLMPAIVPRNKPLEPLSDYGEPPLTQAERKTLRSWHAKKAPYVGK